MATDAELELTVRDRLFASHAAAGKFSRLVLTSRAPADVDREIWNLAWASAREFEVVKAQAEKLAAENKLIAAPNQAPQ